MNRTTSPQDVLEKVRQLNEGRTTAVQTLVAARQSVDAAEAAKAEAIAKADGDIAGAEASAALAYADALKAGWTEQELRSIGLRPPAKPAPKRTRAKLASGVLQPAARTVGPTMNQQLRDAAASVALDKGDGQTQTFGEPAST